MNQSAIIVGSLLAGFVLFLAARNRLGTYVGVLWGPTPDVPQPAATETTAGPGVQQPTTSQAGQSTGIPGLNAGDMSDIDTAIMAAAAAG